jgi:predicted TIM-barrel fold metal-dependent hydrolase
LLHGNDEVLRVVRQHRGRFLGSIYVDPRDKDWRETIDRYHGEGFRCIKMWPPVGYYPDDQQFLPVFEHISNLKLPVLLHAGLTNMEPTTDSKYADPIRMEALVRRFPDIRFILAHWGGLGTLHQAWAIASWNPTVYMDTSGKDWSWPGVDYYNVLAPLYPLDFNRIVWGTDNLDDPARDMGFYRQVLKEIGKEEFADKVFGETAKALLGL